MVLTLLQSVLRRHDGKVSGLASLDNLTDDEDPLDTFTLSDLLQPDTWRPLLVSLVLMMLLQLSGQGSVTFYAGHIFQESSAPPSLRPNDCALIIGLTYLLSSILSLVLRNLIGRRILLLVSQAGMGVSMLAAAAYFHSTAQQSSTGLHNLSDITLSNHTDHVISHTEHHTDHVISHNHHNYSSWLLLPVLQMFTFFYNIGLGSLIWTVATEILPPR